MSTDASTFLFIKIHLTRLTAGRYLAQTDVCPLHVAIGQLFEIFTLNEEELLNSRQNEW